ncbi:MAG TPA: GNAT family N-acetyltransferase [Gaiellaceae bacterium]
MIAIRAAETDADLEAWREVRMAVLPDERAPTVEELRLSEANGELQVLAELDGALAGSGVAGRSTLEGMGFVAARVLPVARRRGVGAAILQALAEHVVELGFDRAFATVIDPEGRAFAERFGFREIGRQIEQARPVGDEPEPASPDGVTIISVADRPELWPLAYDAVAVEAFADLPVPSPAVVSREEWESEWMTWAEGTFLALADGEIVGCAGLLRDEDHLWRAEHALTAVRRDWRGRGVASALKRRTIAWAAHSGIRELYTWTQEGNADMRRLNERLGYVTRRECVNLAAPLPLP